MRGKKGVVVMATITNGPGKLDILTALLRGEEFQLTITDPPRGLRKMAVKMPELSVLTFPEGTIAEIQPGVWVECKGTYYIKSRTGQIIYPQVEMHPVCDHAVIKGTNICPKCGAKAMDVG